MNGGLPAGEAVELSVDYFDCLISVDSRNPDAQIVNRDLRTTTENPGAAWPQPKKKRGNHRGHREHREDFFCPYSLR